MAVGRGSRPAMGMSISIYVHLFGQSYVILGWPPVVHTTLHIEYYYEDGNVQEWIHFQDRARGATPMQVATRYTAPTIPTKKDHLYT